MKKLCIALMLALLCPFQLAADEVTDAVNDIAVKLVQQLPMNKKIALKSLSPEETGLPDSFLRQLMSETEAALMNKSEFEIKLLNRTSTEQIWEDAVEFGDADFDQLYAASQAAILLILDAQAAATGLTMNFTAYALDGDESGRVIASSGAVKVDIDLEKAFGIDVKTISDDIAQIIKKIQEISSSGGLISNPSDFSEYFHNARTYQERGQNELAIGNYQEALLLESSFYDPLYEYLELLVAKYGLNDAEKFFHNQISRDLKIEQRFFALVYFSQELTDFFPRSAGISGKRSLLAEPFYANFVPPTHALFLRKFGDTLQSVMENENFGDLSGYPVDISVPAAISARYLLMRSSSEVLNSYQTGDLANYFIDNLKGSLFSNVDKLKQNLEAARIAFLFHITLDHYYGTSGYVLDGKKEIRPRYKQRPVSYQADDWQAYQSLPCGYDKSNIPQDYGTPVITKLNAIGQKKYMPNFTKRNELISPIYADKCIDQMLALKTLKLSTDSHDYYNIPLGQYDPEKRTVRTSAFNLGIFDEIDLSKPVLLHIYYYEGGEGDPHYTVDIRSDGTKLVRGIQWHEAAEDRMGFTVKYPRVLTGNSIIQSSINYSGRDQKPAFVSYHDVRGEFQKVKIIQPPSGGLYREMRPYADLNTSQISKFTKGTLNRFVNKPASCGVNDKKAKVIDVENFTNLRKEAGLNGQIMGRVPLEAQVSVINPGSFLRYDRCAAACNGTNQNAIKQCIDNNDVWIEVQYNGRRGFLSRKFLE